MDKKPYIDDKHTQTRNSLRLFGILSIIVALICIITGFKDAFISPIGPFAINNSSNPFGKFWLMFIGIPLLGVGIAMTKAGYIGKVAEYGAKEITPVAKDAWNYFNEKDDASPPAKSSGGNIVNAIQCNSCQHLNATTSVYCNQCGNAL